MTRVRAATVLLLAAGIAGGILPAQDTHAHTDFSGRWRMDKAKSDFGKAPVPDIVVRVVEQHDPTLNLHTVQTTGTKTSISDVTYSTNGAETTNVINGHDAISRTFWDGPALVVRTTVKLPSGDEDVEDRWELSPDKQTLTTTSRVRTAKGGADLVLVCTRENGGS